MGKVSDRKEDVRKALLEQGFPDDYTAEDRLVALSSIRFTGYKDPDECDIQTVESLLHRGSKLYFAEGMHGNIPKFSLLSCDEILSNLLHNAKWGEHEELVKKVLDQAVEIHGSIDKITVHAMPVTERIHLLDHLVQSVEVSHKCSTHGIKLLADYGVNLEKRNKHNETAVGYCLKKGVSGASNFSGTEQPFRSIPLTALLNAGADITCTVPGSRYRDFPGDIDCAYSLLFTGFFEWSKEIIQPALKQLQDKGINPSDQVISVHDVESSGVLTNYSPFMGPNPGPLTPLEASVLAGQKNAVHCLLEIGVSPDIRPIITGLLRSKGSNPAFASLEQYVSERSLTSGD
jgi:hypothetical protein